MSLAFPNLVAMSSHTLLAVVNAVWVGRMGTAELGAIGVATTLVYLVVSFPLGLLNSVRTPVSTRFGAGDEAEARGYTWQGVWLALGFGLLVLPFAPVGSVLFPWLGASPEVVAAADDYARLRVWGAPLLFLVTALGSGFQGRGDSRTPMVANLAANVVNGVLDPILVFGWGPVPAFGMAGAAFGVDAGFAVALAVLVWRARAVLGDRVVGPSRALLAGVWAIGGPSALQFLLDVLSFVGFQALLASSGDVSLAAHVVVVRIVMTSFLPAQALSDAVAVLVGQSRGAGRPRDALRAARLGAVQVTALMAFMAVVFVGFPEPLVGVFGVSDAVLAVVRPILFLYAGVQVLDGLAQVLFGALNGAGDTRYTFAVALVGAWLVKLPVAAFLVLGLGMGAYGAWLGIAAECVWQVATTAWRLRGVRWLQGERRARIAVAT